MQVIECTTGRPGLADHREQQWPPPDDPEQPWETILDHEVHSPYQVRIEHAGEADSIFETLMGGDVARLPPRALPK